MGSIMCHGTRNLPKARNPWEARACRRVAAPPLLQSFKTRPGTAASPTMSVLSFRSLLQLWTTLMLGAGWMLAQAPLDTKQLGYLTAISRGRLSGRWAELGTNELRNLRIKAEGYDAEIQKHHLVGGLVVSTRYSDTERTRLLAYENLGQSAAMTGFYLAGMAYWFSVDIKPQALERIRESLTGIETLLGASGRPGFLPAFVAPADLAPYRATYATLGGPDPARPGFGIHAFPGTGPGKDLVWIGGASRDTYSGVALGLGMTFKRIREPRIRLRVSNVVEQILHRLDADQWRIRDGQGSETFITPLLECALLRLGTTINSAGYNERYEASVQRFMEIPPPATIRFGDPTPTVFAVANLMTLTGLETNETRRLGFQDKLTKIWRASSPELNPWLAAAYVNAFDRTPNDAIAGATIQGLLHQFPDPPRWQLAAPPLATNTPMQTVNSLPWTLHARPLLERRVAPFQWTLSPHDPHPGTNEPVAHPGIDFLTTFWIARDSGVIPHESIQRYTNARPGFVRSPALRRPSSTNAPPRTNRPPTLK